MRMPATYDWPSVDSNDEVEPWLNGQFKIRIPQHLETKGPLVVASLYLFAIQAGHEAVERIEHGFFSREALRERKTSPREVGSECW